MVSPTDHAMQVSCEASPRGTVPDLSNSDFGVAAVRSCLGEIRGTLVYRSSRRSRPNRCVVADGSITEAVALDKAATLEWNGECPLAFEIFAPKAAPSPNASHGVTLAVLPMATTRSVSGGRTT
jgi:hypothetical protein